jgi:hypothetical protein
MIKIPSTTLCCIDCYNHELSIKALIHCLRICHFNRTLFFTNREFFLDKISTVKIPDITTKEDYSRFVIKELNYYIDTEYVLLIQYDGFIINPDAWSDEFKQFDYIGAKWHWYTDGFTVGNGGFSLRSKKLLEVLSDDGVVIDSLDHGEDTFICRNYRRVLENRHNINFAPESIAERFSYERSEPLDKTFGFHGLFNMWRYIKADKLENFVSLLSPKTLGAIEAVELGFNYHKRGRLKEAEIVYREILKHHPYRDNVRSMLNKINPPRDFKSSL